MGKTPPQTSKVFANDSCLDRVYSRPLLVVTITPNLSPLSFETNIFIRNSKNNICLRGAGKQNALFFKKCAPKNVPMPLMFRIDPA